MRKAALVLALGWWFAVYPIEAPDVLPAPPRLHGPYPTVWACLHDAFAIDLRSRRAFTTYCFLDDDS